jgi:hypothetical protein
MSDVVEYLLEHFVFLVPILLVAATMIVALLKRLVKLALIVGIAGGLYIVLVRNGGAGF